MNHDDFVQELSRAPTHAILTAQDLQYMAKEASHLFLRQGTPLNKAVVKVASSRPEMSQEQVKRIVEMANVSTFQSLFEKQAGDKNIHFDIADPNEVLRELSSFCTPVVKVASSDYAAPPPRSAVQDLEADVAMCAAFGHSLLEKDKVASVLDDPNPLELTFPDNRPEAAFLEMTKVAAEAQPVEGDLLQMVKLGSATATTLRQQLDRVKEAAQSDLDTIPEAEPHSKFLRERTKLAARFFDVEQASAENNWRLKEAQQTLSDRIVSHIREGGSLGEVVHLLESLGSSEQVKTAMADVFPRLTKSYRPDQLADLQADLAAYEMTKSAAKRVVNLDHPIAAAFAGVVKLAEVKEVLKQTHLELSDLMKEANAVLASILKDSSQNRA